MGNITTDFINATKKIHADVRAILRTLHLIQADVRAISDKGVSEPQEQPTEQKVQTTNHEQAKGLSGGSKALNVNEANGEQEKSGDTAGNYFYDLINSFKNTSRTSKFWFELVALAVVVTYTCETKRTNDLTHDTLDISQGAYVSIGRKDGIIAEFLFPKTDTHSNGGIVIYFQNNGHLPARFNWGLLTPIITIPESPDFPALESAHKFAPMTRTRNLKDGSTGEGGGVTIPGESLYVEDVVELLPERIVRQMKENRLFMLNGAYEYCDALGNYSCRQFSMFYQGEPFNRFSESSDIECFKGLTKISAPDPNVEYLLPCETKN